MVYIKSKENFLKLNSSKYYLVVLCWFFIVAFLVAALCFHRLASLYGVLGYFAISYALIISLYFVIFLHIMSEEINGKSKWRGDLLKLYKDLRIELFFPAGSTNNNVGFRIGLIICLFILLPLAIYQRINGANFILYIPISVLVGFCVYGQARFVFENVYLFFSNK